MSTTEGNKTSDFLYLTTTGRNSGLRREVEIWFVELEGRYYILAEHGLRTQWVKNILKQGSVRVRVGGREFGANARVLDETLDSDAWKLAQRLSREKYNWGDGLPVEIIPSIIE